MKRIELSGKTALQLKDDVKYLLKLIADLERIQPSPALALANGVKQKIYRFPLDGDLVSYSGKALVIMDDGSNWLCIGKGIRIKDGRPEKGYIKFQQIKPSVCEEIEG